MKNMKFTHIVIIIILLIATIFIYNKYSLSTFKNNSQNKNTIYDIQASLDDYNKRLSCHQKIIYTNNTSKSIEDIYFHIYPNAYSNEKHAPFEKNEFSSAYPNGFSKGYISINEIVGKNYNIKHKIMGKKEDLLKVSLGYKLKPGEETVINIDYDVKIPNSYGRFGYGENTVNVTNWYPIACVYDKNGWNKKSYETIGDPFYSEVSNFNVDIKIPSKYKLATSGEVYSSNLENEVMNYKIKGNNMRDFAFILSKEFNISFTQVDDTKIYNYYISKDVADTALKSAKMSLETFNKLFGKYPYKTYNVVESNFYIGGMEYPNLSMIDKTLYNIKNKQFLEYVIAHETAHQWWYSCVGNDEINNPWVDEALTEYSTILYYENNYGKEIKNNLINQLKNNTKNYKIKDVFKKTTDFNNSKEYSLCVYSKGAIVLDAIRNKLGDDVFFTTLREYYKNNMYKNVTNEYFINMWKERGIDFNKLDI